MIKRMKLGFIFVLMFSMLLSACSSDGGDSDNPSSGNGNTEESTSVKMIYWPGPESEAMQKVVDAYNKGQGKKDNVKVEMVLISRGGTYEKEATMMSSKSSEVDLYFTASYLIGQHANYLVPLNDKLPMDNYLESSIKSLTVKGNTLGIPMDVSNHFLFYRKDLMEKLLNNSSWQKKYQKISQKVVGKSLTPKKPSEWNWNDFIATAAFFTKEYNSESPTEYGTSLQLKSLTFNVMIWDDLLWSNGGSWLNEQGEPNFNSDAAKRAMNIYKTIYEKGLTSPNSTVAEFPETQAALKTGSAAFAIQWGAGYSELNNPEKSPNIAGKIGIAPIPAGSAGSKTHVHSLALGLNKYSKHKKAALKWMKYLTTSKAMKIYAENGGIPAIPKVLKAMGEKRPILPIIAEHIEKYGYSEPILPETQKILQELAVELSPAWVGEEKVDVALKNAQKAVESVLPDQ